MMMEDHIRAIGQGITNMAMEFTLGLMASNTMVYGKKENNMVMAPLLRLMVIGKEELGTMEKSYVIATVNNE